MNADTRIPGSLRVVAALWIFTGVCAAIEVVVSLMNNRISINSGVLDIFIGLGLLRLSRGWRTCALVLLWIALIGTPIITILMIGHSGPLDFKILGQKVGHAPKELGLAMAVALFLLALWQYRVLTSQRVRRLFGLDKG